MIKRDMDREYWIGRWERQETGWHQQDVDLGLQTYFSDLKPTRVFVPLCGKSLDLKWLKDQGHEVIGAELSELACTEFFQENQIPFTRRKDGPFEVFEGEGITLWNGDILELRSEKIGSLGAVYDRAALMALPSEIRIRYVEKLKELVSAPPNPVQNFKYLLEVFERIPADPIGPPFSVSIIEIENLYGSMFKVKLLDRKRLLGKESESAATDLCAYLLTR